MTISVILPVYNKIQYLPTTLFSLLSQTFRDFELIAVDDGSTDGSGELLDEIAVSDARVKVIHKQNAGVSAARNTALDAALGEYIVFADGDDTVSPDWLEMLFSEIESTKADMVISGLTKIDESGNILGTVCPSDENIITSGELYDNLYKLQNNGLLGFCVGKLFRRAMVCKSGIRFDESLKLAEDLDFFMRLYRYTDKIKLTRYCEYNYLQATENSAIYMNAYKIDYLSQIHIWLRIKSLLEAQSAYNQQNQKFIEHRLLNYICCSLLYNSSSSQISVKKLRKLCSVSFIKHAVEETALKPIAFGYALHSNLLCRCYAGLFKLYISKRR